MYSSSNERGKVEYDKIALDSDVEGTLSRTLLTSTTRVVQIDGAFISELRQFSDHKIFLDS